jgi:hypothetical protein
VLARWRSCSAYDSTDSLLVVDLCPRCAGNVIADNHVEGWTDPPSTFRVISKGTASQPAPATRSPRKPFARSNPRAANPGEELAKPDVADSLDADDSHVAFLDVGVAHEGGTQEQVGHADDRSPPLPTGQHPLPVANGQLADQVPPNDAPSSDK